MDGWTGGMAKASRLMLEVRSIARRY